MSARKFGDQTEHLSRGGWNLLSLLIAGVAALLIVVATGVLLYQYFFADPPSLEQVISTCIQDVHEEHRRCSRSRWPLLQSTCDKRRAEGIRLCRGE